VAEVDDAPEQPDVAFGQLLLNTRGPRRTTAKVTEVIWGSRVRIHELVADQYRAGRVLLAGDLRCDNPEVDSLVSGDLTFSRQAKTFARPFARATQPELILGDLR